MEKDDMIYRKTGARKKTAMMKRQQQLLQKGPKHCDTNEYLFRANNEKAFASQTPSFVEQHMNRMWRNAVDLVAESRVSLIAQ